MGKQQSKEETVIVQNAAAGNNQATADELRFHMSTSNIILSCILLILLLGLLGFIYRLYKRCHKKWITNEINRTTMRRSLFRRRVQLGATEPSSKNYEHEMV